MKQRGEQLLIHVAPSLKAEVQGLAAEEGRTVSDYVRRLLIAHVTGRVVDREIQKAA